MEGIAVYREVETKIACHHGQVSDKYDRSPSGKTCSFCAISAANIV
jgi:hypothetical protein